MGYIDDKLIDRRYQLRGKCFALQKKKTILFGLIALVRRINHLQLAYSCTCSGSEEHMHVINSLFVLQFVTTYVLDSDITVYPTSEGLTLMASDIKLLGRKQKARLWLD